MQPTTIAAIARLPTMTVAQLRDHYVTTFGEPTASRHKTWLVRRIAWRLQANDEGGLSERAMNLATELAQDAEMRVTAPRTKQLDDPGRTKEIALPASRSEDLAAGTVLRRVWRGQEMVVTVLSNGFDWNGTVYGSLSAVANAITRTRWNGLVFFGLKTQKGSA